MHDYLTKPVQASALYASLARWLPARGAAALDLEASMRAISGNLPLYGALLRDFRAITAIRWPCFVTRS
jgi:hypothetical protein